VVGGVGGTTPLPWSYYLTPVELGFKPWAMDFAPNNYAHDSFPRIVHPDADKLVWQNDDFDPILRFLTLGFDPFVEEWLKLEDPSNRWIMAAREFAKEHKKWQFPETSNNANEDTLLSRGWLEKDVHLKWRRDTPGAWQAIKAEIDQMFDMMEDDREKYLAEINAQADGLPAYVISFLGIDSDRRPHTIELINCGLAMGNMFYMFYKEVFRRVRPSVVAPGLVPPFGPPRHPAFPSGHAFAGHFLALLLLEIPEIAAVHGEPVENRPGRKPTLKEVMSDHVFKSPLMWLAARLAKGRERAGIHYPTDSLGSRWLAGAVWKLLFSDAGSLREAKPPNARRDLKESDLINVPTLRRVLAMAKAEWAR
jgi:membrane-associated phospholipid phosphatase